MAVSTIEKPYQNKTQYITSGDYAFSPNEHKNIDISYTMPEGFQFPIVLSTANPAWVFASVVGWNSSIITLGVYCTASSVTTGKFRIALICK